MTNIVVKIITKNNSKCLQSSKKQLKLIEYLKNKLEFNAVIFLQETHSVSDERKSQGW